MMNRPRIFRYLLITVLAVAAGIEGFSQTSTREQFQLQAISPQFWDLIDRDAKMTVVATGFKFTEGPVWDPAGFLYFSDEAGNYIYRIHPGGTKEEVIAIGDPDGNTFDRQHRLIDCSSILRAVVEVTADGKYKILADNDRGKKLNTPNDVVLGPDGALYFTNPNMDFRPGMKQEIPFQGVYRLDDKGNLRLLTKDLPSPTAWRFLRTQSASMLTTASSATFGYMT